MPIHPAHCEQENNLVSNYGHQIHTAHISRMYGDFGLPVKDGVVMHLTSCFTGQREIVIMDDFFTSLSPVNKLIASKTSTFKRKSEQNETGAVALCGS